MDIIWLLNGEVLSRLYGARGLRHSRSQGDVVGDTTGNGNAQGTSPVFNARRKGRLSHLSLETFVTEIYRACLLGGSDSGQQRPAALMGIRGYHGSPDSQGQQFVESLCILFDLVDIDGAGVIDWMDFTDFCVYMRGGAGDVAGGGHQGSEGGSDNKGACSGGGSRHDDEENDVTRFTERLGYIDRSSHCHEIRSMRFNKELQLLMVVEGGPIIKIYRAGPHRVGEIEPALAMKRHFFESKSRSVRLRPAGRSHGAGKRGGTPGGGGARGTEENTAALAAEFVGQENQAVVSCADGYLTSWDVEKCRMLRSVRLRDVQVGLRFCPALGLLASWGVDDFNHEILVWDLDEFKVVHVLNDGHSDPVKDVREVALPLHQNAQEPNERAWEPMIATAGMDGKVVVWDLRRGSYGQARVPKKLFILTGHYHGVLSLAYSDEHDLIISAGFDYEAFCWERSTSHLHMKLEGHRRPLIGVAIVHHEKQRAVTGDEGGSFRLWEIRRGPSAHGTCLQTFSIGNSRAAPRTMVIPWREGLIAAGSKMHMFRAEQSMKVAATPGGAWFSPYTGEICVLLREAVFLDASNGQIVRRCFQQPPGCDITAFCLDSRHKKAVVGDQRGQLRLYDGVTGRWVMSATPHRSEVSALLFMDEDSTFISAGWDRKIQVHDATVRTSESAAAAGYWQQTVDKEKGCHSRPSQSAKLLRSVEGAHDGDISSIAASAKLGLLATASSDLTVRLWDYSLLRLEEIIVVHRQEISCASFLDPLPCFATADMGGKVLIWATRPHPSAGCLLAVIRNSVITTDVQKGGRETLRCDQPQRKVLPTPITSIAFSHSRSGRTATALPSRHHGEKQDDQGSPSRVKASDTPMRPVSDLHSEHGPSPVGGNVLARNGPRSTIFTGDEKGFIKLWDVTCILIDKLGVAAYDAALSEVDATTATSAKSTATLGGDGDKKRSHQFVHHRESPLDGISLHTATRFRELINIAKILREGGHLPSTQTEEVANKLPQRDDAERISNHASVRAGSRHSGVGSDPSLCRELGVSDNDNVEVYSKTRRTPLASSGATQRALGGVDEQIGGASALVSRVSTRTSPERGPQGGRHYLAKTSEAGDIYAEVEVALNAQVDVTEPFASWAPHSSSVISLQIILEPSSIATGSSDGSARVCALDGSQLGVLIDQNKAETAPWFFNPPIKGRQRKAVARAATLREILNIFRRTQHHAKAENRGEKNPGTNAQVFTVVRGDKFPVSATHAPANDSVLPSGDTSPRDNRDSTNTVGGGQAETGSAAKYGGHSADVGQGRPGRLDGERAALSAACLSKIREITHPVGNAPSEDSGTQSSRHGDGQNDTRAPQESIDARLMSEAREGQKYHAPHNGASSVRPSTAKAAPVRGAGRMGNGGGATEWQRAGGSETLPHKTPPNLHAEQQRKQVKRTRSTLQYLRHGIDQTEGIGHGAITGEFFPLGQSRHRPPGTETPGIATVSNPCRALPDRPRTGPGMRLAERTSITERPGNEENNMASKAARTTDDGIDLRFGSSAPTLRGAVVKVSPLARLKICSSGPTPLVAGEKGGTVRAGPAENEPLSRLPTGIYARVGSSTSVAAVGNDFRLTIQADRRHRRINRILHKVCQIEEDNAQGMASSEQNQAMTTTTTRTTTTTTTTTTNSTNNTNNTNNTSNNNNSRDGNGDQYSSSGNTDIGRRDDTSTVGAAGKPEQGGKGLFCVRRQPTIGILSDRVRTVLSRFERLVHGGANTAKDPTDEERAGAGQVSTINTALEKRVREKRSAARKSAIRHNERYRRAQRFNLNAMQQTQQRRQEATVGLSGSSGERFGPYSLEDVFEFQAFASHLGAHGADLLTIRGLLNNPGIQDDAYTHALLQDLARTRVVHWNQPLSLEYIMQLVFHFAKNEELKRMINAMEVVLLLERVRDVYMKGVKDEQDALFSGPGSSTLSPHVASDIDITFRATCTEACGTCTLKELAAMMIKIGSDLYPNGQEELEVVASACGVNGHKELTARDLMSIITALASLRRRGPGQTSQQQIQ